MHKKNITHKLYIAKVQNTMKYMCFIYQMHHKYKPSGQRCPHGSAPSIIIILDALGVILVALVLKSIGLGFVEPTRGNNSEGLASIYVYRTSVFCYLKSLSLSLHLQGNSTVYL